MDHVTKIVAGGRGMRGGGVDSDAGADAKL